MDGAMEKSAVAVDEVKNFIIRCMLAVKTPLASAELVAEVLSTADYRGHYSHGINRLDLYVNDVLNGNYDVNAEPVIIKETAGTAYVDGRNGIGMVIGSFCMDLAIKKAKENGIGLVTCTGSNHYGMAGYYSLKAVKQQLIGMSFTNTSPQVVPTRSKTKSIGTNPISFGAPSREDDYFMLDMATSTVAYGKVEVKNSTEGSVPAGWIVDKDGEVIERNALAWEEMTVTINPEDVTKGDGGLLPLGGVEPSSGYKGYGLSMMVETLCGVLSGGPCGRNIRAYRTSGQMANLGQTFIAINPDCFANGFTENMQKFMDEMRELEPVDVSCPVKVAGDLSRERMAFADKAGGIPYHKNYIDSMNKLAEKLNVEPIKLAS